MAPEIVGERRLVADRMIEERFSFSLGEAGGCLNCAPTGESRSLLAVREFGGRTARSDGRSPKSDIGASPSTGGKPGCWMPMIQISSVQPSGFASLSSKNRIALSSELFPWRAAVISALLLRIPRFEGDALLGETSTCGGDADDEDVMCENQPERREGRSVTDKREPVLEVDAYRLFACA